jgi:hypothetical protein
MKRRLLIASTALLALAASPTKPVSIHRQSKLLDFTYAWPAEAAAIPQLNGRFRSNMSKAFSDAQKYAHEDMALTREQKRNYNQHYYSAAWESLGLSSRLLSLQGAIESFTGGAHPNHEFKAIIWDRRLNRQVSMADLFARPGDFGTLTRTSYCARLDKERRKRREGEKLGGEFDQCPKFTELAIAPVDRNNDGRFDGVDFVASPYVAGPYAEGEYEIPLTVTSRLIAALKPEYRSSFEAQRAQ